MNLTLSSASKHPGICAALIAASILLGACSHISVTQEKPAALKLVTREQITEIVNSPDRTQADRTNDIRRKPVDMLTFIGIQPGSVALDLSAGAGYTTELLARTTGPTGRAYGQSQPPRTAEATPRPGVTPEGNANPVVTSGGATAPTRTPTVRRSSAQAVFERAKSASLANLFAVVRVFEDPVPPELCGQLDLVTFMFNYHDLGHMGVDRARMNAALFNCMKPGATYVIADHAGRPGSGIAEAGTLHRIDESFLQKEVEAAGFKLVSKGEFLRNPSDPRDKNTPEPAQPKDEFVLKFVRQ